MVTLDDEFMYKLSLTDLFTGKGGQDIMACMDYTLWVGDFRMRI